MKKPLINLVIGSLLLNSLALLAQTNLSETCSKALADINTLSSFITTTNPNDFRASLEYIHNNWADLMANDHCTLGNCAPDSSELKMSAIILTVNGLSSQLMIHRDLGIPSTLQESVDGARTLINKNCN
jgi:hypothetical protein